jgi:hypothetical protein
MLTRRRFRSLDDWMAFCGERGSNTDGLSEGERVDVVQQVSQLLGMILTTHENAAELVNLWLASHGATHRLFPVVGKRIRRS